MRNRIASLLFASALVAAPVAVAPAIAQHAPGDFTQIVAEMSPAVVAVRTSRLVGGDDPRQVIPPELRERFGQGPAPDGADEEQAPRQAQGQGSGFLVSDEGHIVTNNHVIEGATEIQVVLADGSMQAAELVGADPATDLAVLRVEPIEGMVVAPWGDSEAMQPGAWTIAIGSPFGLGGTVTVGVLSALSLDIRSGPYDDFLQTDASINRGNSGGPLFNADGQVIGVNTAIFSPTGTNVGIGFAVPSRTARLVVDELIEHGEVRRGFIGVRLQTLTEPMARALDLASPTGALVAHVEQAGPGDEAGLVPGDVVIELDGVVVADPRALSFAVAERDPGEEVTLTVQRDGQPMEIRLTLGTRDFAEATASIGTQEQPGAENGRLGLALSPIPDPIRQELGIEEGGLMVQRVEADGPAAEAGLMANDVILQAGGAALAEPDDLTDAWQQAAREGRPLLLRVQRGETMLFVALEG